MGETVYIGKGTGRRLHQQKRRFASDGEIMERLSTESAAYKREREMIALYKPPLNRHPGGNGSRFGQLKGDKVSDTVITETVARCIITLSRYKQIRHFKTDIRVALLDFISSIARKWGREEFEARMRPFNIKVVDEVAAV